MAKKELDGIEVIKINSVHVMMISDLHFGWNVSSEEWQNNMDDYFRNWFIPYLKEMKEKYPDLVLLCLGDVFTDRKSIDINVYNLVMDIFEELSLIVPVYIIYGNHDLAKKTNKGNSSLRSLTNIKNIVIIKDVSHIKFMNGRSVLAQAVAIPYLGDCSEENKMLLKFGGIADYAFMHTEISNMKMDNGMTIVGGVDSEKFTGMIYSGHIHKRQETKRVVYVGSPYQLSRGEIGNIKGIYILDVTDGSTVFNPNNYSPIFQKIPIEKLWNMNQFEQDRVLKNNYTEIIVHEEDIDTKYKKTDIYELCNKIQAKGIQLDTIKAKVSVDVDEEAEYVELSMEELINTAIDSITDVTDEKKSELKSLSSKYFKNAMSELA